MSHFNAIGFTVSDPSELEEMIMRAEARAEEAGSVVEHRDGRTSRYVDPSGATLTVHFDRAGSIACGQPGFDSERQFSWRPTGLAADPEGCRFCDLVLAEMLGEADGNEEMLYPFALTVETIGEVRKRIRFKRPGFVSFAALLEEGEVWADEDAFYASQDDEVKMAAQSLIPVGLFGGGATSQILANGTVRAAEERENELGGAAFFLVQLETLGGIFDVCAAPEEVEGAALRPGAVLGGVFWLVGRPLLDPADEESRTFSLPWRRGRSA